MPRSLLALKDRYGRSKQVDTPSDDEEQEVDIEGHDECEQQTNLCFQSKGRAMAVQEENSQPEKTCDGDMLREKEKAIEIKEGKIPTRVAGQERRADDKETARLENDGNHRSAKSKISVPAIELGMWPKPIRGIERNSDEGIMAKYHDLESRLYRPWERGCERIERHPIRPKASLPRNGFIAEFGHLGFRDHWKRPTHPKSTRVESERVWSNSFAHNMGTMSTASSFEGWALSSGFYSGYFAPYRREMQPQPRECYSCIPISQHACLEAAKKTGLGVVERQVVIAAEKFRQQHQQDEQETAHINPRKRHLLQGDVITKKRRLGLYWTEESNERVHSTQQKTQRVANRSPTYDCVTAEKTKDAQERPYNCTVCDKTFKRRSSLATHKFIHTDLKPHVCSVCNKRFLRKSDLKKHGLMHSGKKPYQCEKCGRRFSQSSNMLTHLRRHMGIRPFECSICGRSFFRKVDLKRHEGRHIAKKLKTKCDDE